MRVVEKGVGKGAEMEVEKAVADMVAGTRVERMVGLKVVAPREEGHASAASPHPM